MVTAEGAFSFETCLLKHHVRSNVWLPLAKEQLKAVRAAAKTQKDKRRLRYFTFCAVGAIDVLMLDLAKVVRTSESGRFDTVFFFDKDAERVAETNRRIPGANGFVGNFVETVLRDDPQEATGFDPQQALQSPQTELDESETRANQRQLAVRRRFIQSFPFDVINLDLEEHLFKDRDEFPGNLILALRKVFEWQCRPMAQTNGKGKPIDSFTLFFTTRIGPRNLSEDYQRKLEGNLKSNLVADPELVELLRERAGSDDIPTIRGQDFDLFFKLATPKMLAATLQDADWYVEARQGIVIYEFERDSATGPYQMLHLAMHVRRQDPPFERRGPKEEPPVAADAYRAVVRAVFSRPEEIVTVDSIDHDALKKHLSSVFARRKKYYPEDEPPEL
jgi:hypothetical protein